VTGILNENWLEGPPRIFSTEFLRTSSRSLRCSIMQAHGAACEVSMSEVKSLTSLSISHGEACDRGKVREDNQDSVRRATIALGELFIVADGIGGYQGGATASKMVAEGFHAQLAACPADYPAQDALREACAETNAAIYAAAHGGGASVQRMGSTVVVALLQTGANGNATALIGHVGDSRAYLIRNGSMSRITSDHSAVQALLNRNLLTEEEARNHPDASVLTRSLGHRPTVEIEINEIALQPGDALLLCSDGLWGYVPELDIAAVAVDRELSAQTIADTLLHQALAVGGQDNIGIEVVRISGGTDGLSAAAMPPESYAAARSGLSRTHIVLASVIGLALLAGCGYLGYRMLQRNRSAPVLVHTDPKPKTLTAAVASQASVKPEVKPPPMQPTAAPEIVRPSKVAAADTLKRSILVVGGSAGGGDDAPSSANTIHWQHLQFTHASKPACAQLAELLPVVYAAPQVNMNELLTQHPELAVLGKLKPRPIDAPVRRACGSYDVILILPRSGFPIAGQ
jgi:PPM family protein phosphatase